ncbi:MAG TPA: hypothetical protein VD816_04810, partial [Ohtaekwangia sp.]|nr:hypothetical protein [Ohtaekwangia sp.]
AALAKRSFDEAHQQCRAFWNSKLDGATVIDVPEKRIADMLKAGLFHLDQVTYGNEPDGTLAPTIGVYSPIGTESSPIIQFYSSMEKTDWAKRSLQYFLDKQHGDGLMQNFGGYMVETGAVLWNVGEYFRYSRDEMWIRESKTKLLRSCDYLLAWRARNKVPHLNESGYGLIDGKVADPEDHFHQFMLNAYAYLGISRMAETFREIDPAMAARLQREAKAWRKDIRAAFFRSMSHSPVVPLGDGTWCPTAPPWTEAAAPRALYLTPEKYFSHGTFTVPDALLGPLYLVFCEVLTPGEEASKMLLAYHSELFYQHNAALSQPYYSRHDWVQLKRGMVKPFLQTYYTSLAAMADRETFTFWEHLYQVSVHKTHEEAWFLMQTRWMLYLEEGDTLRLLSGVPRVWLEDGKSINVVNAGTYFGKVSFGVKSDVAKGVITATIVCQETRKPRTVLIRLPHPAGKNTVHVEGGMYDPATESVTIENFTGKAQLVLRY